MCHSYDSWGPLPINLKVMTVTRFPPSKVTFSVTPSVHASSSHCSHDRHLGHRQENSWGKKDTVVGFTVGLIGDNLSNWTYLLYGVNLPIVMGICSALLSSALPQILSPHGPLLNNTTWWTFGGTTTDTRQEPSALKILKHYGSWQISQCQTAMNSSFLIRY